VVSNLSNFFFLPSVEGNSQGGLTGKKLFCIDLWLSLMAFFMCLWLTANIPEKNLSGGVEG